MNFTILHFLSEILSYPLATILDDDKVISLKESVLNKHDLSNNVLQFSFSVDQR